MPGMPRFRDGEHGYGPLPKAETELQLGEEVFTR